MTVISIAVQPLAMASTAEDDSSPNDNHGGRLYGTKNTGRVTSTWLNDYLAPNSVYGEAVFARWFTMPKYLFKKLACDIVEELSHH